MEITITINEKKLYEMIKEMRETGSDQVAFTSGESSTVAICLKEDQVNRMIEEIHKTRKTGDQSAILDDILLGDFSTSFIIVRNYTLSEFRKIEGVFTKQAVA